MQEHPICFDCDEPIKDPLSMVFEAPCGHEGHASAVFHGLCLMRWREAGREDMRRFSRYISELMGRAHEMGMVPRDHDDE